MRLQSRPYYLGTEVELFRDEASASAYLRKQRSDFERARGRVRQGVNVVDVDSVEIGGVGEEAVGICATVSIGAVGAFTTIVGFRRGRIVGSATVLHAIEFDSMPEGKRLAGELDDRIKAVIAGEIKTAAVPGQEARSGGRTDLTSTRADLRERTLTAGDLSLRMSRARERYVHSPVVDVHFREYESRGERLGGSEILYLRTMTQAFKNTRLALRDHRFLASRTGSRSVARRFLRNWFRGTGFAPRRLEVRTLPSPHDDLAAMQIYFDAPKGSVEAVMVSARRGRIRASATVLGLASKVKPRDVLALGGRLRTRAQPNR